MPKSAIALAAGLLALGLFGALRSTNVFGGSEEPVHDPVAESLTYLPEISGPVPPARNFAHMGELISDLEEDGLECSELQNMGVTGHPTLRAFKICDVGTSANRLDLYLYKNRHARDRWFESRLQSGLPWVYGPNWIVVIAGEPQTAPKRLELVRRAIGGRVGRTT